MPGDEAQGGLSPAPRFPALPAVFGGLGSRQDLLAAFLLGSGYPRLRGQAGFAVLTRTQVWRDCCLSSGAARLRLSGAISAAGSRGTAPAWPGRCHKAVAEV